MPHRKGRPKGLLPSFLILGYYNPYARLLTPDPGCSENQNSRTWNLVRGSAECLEHSKHSEIKDGHPPVAQGRSLASPGVLPSPHSSLEWLPYPSRFSQPLPGLPPPQRALRAAAAQAGLHPHLASIWPPSADLSPTPLKCSLTASSSRAQAPAEGSPRSSWAQPSRPSKHLILNPYVWFSP